VRGRHLDKIANRLDRIAEWLNGAGSRRAAAIPATPGVLRNQRAADLRRLVEQDVPELIKTVRELNLRGRERKCAYCGASLRLFRGPRAGLYAMRDGENGVLIQDPNCPSAPDGQHQLRNGEGT